MTIYKLSHKLSANSSHMYTVHIAKIWLLVCCAGGVMLVVVMRMNDVTRSCGRENSGKGWRAKWPQDSPQTKNGRLAAANQQFCYVMEIRCRGKWAGVLLAQGERGRRNQRKRWESATGIPRHPAKNKTSTRDRSPSSSSASSFFELIVRHTYTKIMITTCIILCSNLTTWKNWDCFFFRLKVLSLPRSYVPNNFQAKSCLICIRTFNVNETRLIKVQKLKKVIECNVDLIAHIKNVCIIDSSASDGSCRFLI